MPRMSRRTILGSMTAVGGLLVAGTVRMVAQPQQPLLVRRDIKDLQEKFPAELEKFKEAVKAFKARTVAGMSAWDFNAQAHRIYCSRDAMEVHGTWWFMPWHRAYLHATERNLQIALNDPTVALPYWHWPITPGVPVSYRSGSLSHERFGESDPLSPALLDLTGMAAPSYRGRVSGDVLVEMAFGGNSATPNPKTRAAIEGTPHGVVHNAVGSFLKNANGQPVDRDGNVVPFNQRIPGDLAILTRAAHDPLFFAHHGNIDRLWEIWRSPADSAHAKSEPWDMQAFLEPPFPFNFLDLKATDNAPYQVKVAQARDTRGLGYRYAVPGEDAQPMLGPEAVLAGGPRREPDSDILGTRTLKSSVPVSMPATSEGAAGATAGSRRYILSLNGLVVDGAGVTAAVYLTTKDTATFQPSDGVYAGILSAVASGLGPTKENLAMDVTEAMTRLQPANANVNVVLVPIKSPTGNYQPEPPAVDRIELRAVH